MAAVKQDGMALQYADESLKRDRDIVLAAVKQNGFVCRYADKSLRRDSEFVLSAVKRNGSALRLADESLKRDRGVVFTAVMNSNDRRVLHQWAHESVRREYLAVSKAAKAASLFIVCPSMLLLLATWYLGEH